MNQKKATINIKRIKITRGGRDNKRQTEILDTGKKIK